jgi:hypothetical protein
MLTILKLKSGATSMLFAVLFIMLEIKVYMNYTCLKCIEGGHRVLESEYGENILCIHVQKWKNKT